MKLTFKDLKQQKFVIEAELSEQISEVKEKIAKEKGWEPSQQKLIYSGKILQDGNTVESYKIEEKGFIVCMVTKPKVSPATSSKAPSTPNQAATATPNPPAAPAQSTSATALPPSTPTPAAGTEATAAADSRSPQQLSSSSIAIGRDGVAAIENIESMGFERPEIEAAMRAAFFNADRAVEYLLNGIPDAPERAAPSAGPPAVSSPPQNPAPAAIENDESVNLFDAAANMNRNAPPRGAGNLFGAGGTGAADAQGGLGNLDWLRNNQQFQQLRQVVQTAPQMLEPILQSVGAGNPQLAHLISQNPNEFLRLLGENGDDDAPLPPGAQAISVTEEEREAIERLCRLGFNRDQAIQAYFACDKNEELAANFLFDQPDDEDDAN